MMSTKENAGIKENNIMSINKSMRIPVLNIRMMTDEEWNQLAYQNWLKRRAKQCGKP